MLGRPFPSTLSIHRAEIPTVFCMEPGVIKAHILLLFAQAHGAHPANDDKFAWRSTGRNCFFLFKTELGCIFLCRVSRSTRPFALIICSFSFGGRGCVFKSIMDERTQGCFSGRGKSAVVTNQRDSVVQKLSCLYGLDFE
jgi:hypothetical protein